MPKRKTNLEFLQELKDKNIPYTPLEDYIDSGTKIKWLCKHGHIFNSSPEYILSGKGCPYCSGRLPIIGETDLWTTHSDIAKMLKNPDDGYVVSYGSSKILEWVCPKCNSVKKMSVTEVVHHGLACKVCSDGISYAEKFMISLLNQLNIDFIHDRYLPWSDKKRYDFYISSLNMIIETHGKQHYIEDKFSNFGGRSLKEEQANDKYKKELALNNGIKYYVQLDCRNSNCEYIKNSILNSILFDVLDLSFIDWDSCEIYASNSLAIKVAELWNLGYDTNGICHNLGMGQTFVLKHLNNMTKLGLCNFNPKEVHIKANVEKLGKKVICVETGKIYPSIGSVAEDGFIPQRVSMCCNKNAKSHRKMHWEFYEDYKEVS